MSANIAFPSSSKTSQAQFDSLCCQQCNKTFTLRSGLKKHMSKFHPTVLPADEVSSDIKCDECDMNFKKFYLLQKHKRHTHSKPSKSVYSCTLCQLQFAYKSALCAHFQLVHEVCIKKTELEFPAYDDFLKWKKKMEYETKSLFTKDTATKEHNGTIYGYFNCHRSGNYVSKGNGSRHLVQGSCRINGFCPASLKVVESMNKCSVSFTSTHIGHLKDLGHLHLTAPEKEVIASKISAKIPFDVILDGIRDSISEAGLERLHLLNKKDLYNIEDAFHLKSVAVQHKDDGTSVEAWVNLMKLDEEQSCVLFYKPQGVLLEDCALLNEDDFVLVIMTEAQGEMLQRFASDCVCMDGTRGLNSYGFELITLLIIDDMRQGFPGAFLISNRTDQDVITIFLSSLKTKLGQLKPMVFMSDMADSFYNAWVQVMAMPKLRLFCTWHVDRAWRKNLSKIEGKENQADVYKVLRTLLEERDVDTFEQMLTSALAMLHTNDTMKEYAEYFEDYYANRARFWAFCYRLHSGLNTNMHIERMHKTIKYIYLQGKNVKRLDKAIHAIMQFVRDKLVDRLIILNKGKITSKISNIRNRHKASLTQQMQIITNKGGWSVLSSDCSELYTITEYIKDCTCQLICEECNSCLHQYSCSCIDSAIKWNMCKHIHSLCRFRKESGDNNCKMMPIEDEQQNLLIDEKAEETHRLTNYLLKPGTSSSNLSFTDKKENVKKKCTDLIDSLLNPEELDVFLKIVSSVKPTIDALRSTAMVSPFVEVSKAGLTQKYSTTKKVILYKENQNFSI